MKILRDFNKKVGLEEWDDEPAQQPDSIPSGDDAEAGAGSQDDEPDAPDSPASGNDAQIADSQESKDDSRQSGDDDGNNAEENKGKFSRLKLYISAAAVAVIVIAAAAFMLIGSLTTVSEAYISGKLIDLEKRGMIFSFYEGIMIPDQDIIDQSRLTPEGRFVFSVANDEIGRCLVEAKAENAPVNLQYKMYLISMPWRGDSKIVVTGVSKADAKDNIKNSEN